MLFAILGRGIVTARSCHLAFLQLGKVLVHVKLGKMPELVSYAQGFCKAFFLVALLIPCPSHRQLRCLLKRFERPDHHLATDFYLLFPVWVKWIYQADADCGIIVTGNILLHRALSIYPTHYSFQVGKFLSFKGVVLDGFIAWIQTSLLKALCDSALANIVTGLSPLFNGR